MVKNGRVKLKNDLTRVEPYYKLFYLAIGLISRVFTNGLEDWDSIPGWVIPKTQKMVLDSASPLYGKDQE